MGFSLIPREMRFFDMFDEVTVHLSNSARAFAEMLKSFDNLDKRSAELKQQEEACDVLTAKLIHALDVSFITPFDREDIHTLATCLDDVMDNLEETAHRFAVYRIDQPTQTALDMARIIQDCCSHIEQAVRQCRDLKKSRPITTHLCEISRLESEADRLYRDADAALLAGGDGNLLNLIKWRELYSWLENTVNACRRVANILSEVVVKGS